MSAHQLMVQGVSANAGKSIVTGALCRWFRNAGHRVAPFKPLLVVQSPIEVDGHRTDTRFAFCARAAGVPVSPLVNPIQLVPVARDRFDRILSPALLRFPEGDTVEMPLLAVDTPAFAEVDAAVRERIWATVADHLERLRRAYDVVIVEGAGSPTDLGPDDITNHRIPTTTRTTTVLVGKLSAGGAASGLVGTLALLDPEVRATVCGFVLNDLIGARATARAMAAALEDRTGLPCLGLFPNLWAEAPWSDQEEELEGLAGLVERELRTDLLLPPVRQPVEGA